MIDVSRFHKVYGVKRAVRGLSFHVRPGEILGLVGPNGAGKTTTLRALSGLLTPSRGRLHVAGHDVERNPVAVKRNLAYVPDDPQLFDDLTVAEHLAFSTRVYNVPDGEHVARQLLDDFELTAQLNTRCRDLSRGMRQKVAVCCAYIHAPQAILFDEPLTGLDPPGIRKLKETIRQRAQAGAAVIISSHLLAMVEDLCTHVLILQNGLGKFFGTVDALRAAYRPALGQVTLEDIFFQATQSPATQSPAGQGATEADALELCGA